MESAREELLRRIKIEAEKDQKNRQDVRFLNTMGLLVAKGFLRTNQQMTLKPNQRIRIEDAIWAGQNVEPRILEVLPAVVLRLPRHFDFDPKRHAELAPILKELKSGADQGPPFQGIPFEKLKIWVDLPLRDKRIKSLAQKRVLKTFRLDPQAVENLRVRARDRQCSETEVIEDLLGFPRR